MVIEDWGYDSITDVVMNEASEVKIVRYLVYFVEKTLEPNGIKGLGDVSSGCESC